MMLTRKMKVYCPIAIALLMLLAGLCQAQKQIPNQVLIEAQVWELSTDSNFNWGVIWDYNKKESSPASDFDIFSADLRLPIFEDQTSGVTNKGLFASGDVLDLKFGILNLRIQAALRKGKAEVLANPKVVVQDGHPASIKTGEQVPLIQMTFDAKRQQHFDTVFKDTGVTLNVTPYIYNASPEFVILDVQPTVNEITQFEKLKSPDGDFELPLVTTRSANSKVIVRSGDTLIIGGLYQEQTIRNINRLPFFGEVPLLNDLFRSRTETTDKRELLIEVRPTVLIPGKDSFVPAPFTGGPRQLSAPQGFFREIEPARLFGIPLPMPDSMTEHRGAKQPVQFIPQRDAPVEESSAPKKNAASPSTSSPSGGRDSSKGSWY